MIYDILIVGGGIVGLASAYKIQKKNPALKILVLEKEKQISAHQTGNNSGVIHSGLYYKPGSLKARNCISGYHELIDFCNAEEIPYELCGKIVVATKKEQLPLMENLYQRGTANGLENIKHLNSQEELREHEPHVAGVAGLHVPQTGIVDYRIVCQKLANRLEENGGEVMLGQRVLDIKEGSGQSTVITNQGTFQAKQVINCAGLYSDKVAEMTQGKIDLRIVPFRGEYFKLSKEKESLVKNLIYPVPDPNFPFLGVHFTRMAKGGVEAGPNAVLAFAREGYKKSQINLPELFETLTWPGFLKVASKYWTTGLGEMYRSFSKAAFTKALQELIPEIQESDLVEGGAGIRAQACDRNGGLVDDFLIFEDERTVNICNAPSPAATSCLSIGEYVADKMIKRF